MTTIDPHIQALRDSEAKGRAAHRTIVKGTSKASTVEKLLGRPRGATMVELIVATGWQNHSVRAFLSGLRKKGRTLVKEERKTGDVAYRVATMAAAPASAAPSANGSEVA